MAIIRLPNFATSQPAIGSDVISPIGKLSRTAPSFALFKCSFVWISGIRDAQLAKHNPAKKKKLLTAIL